MAQHYQQKPLNDYFKSKKASQGYHKLPSNQLKSSPFHSSSHFIRLEDAFTILSKNHRLLLYLALLIKRLPLVQYHFLTMYKMVFHQMRSIRCKSYLLVELIVAITLLAIAGFSFLKIEKIYSNRLQDEIKKIEQERIYQVAIAAFF